MFLGMMGAPIEAPLNTKMSYIDVIETFISTTQDTTVILKFIQYFILSSYIAAISPSYGPIKAEASRANLRSKFVFDVRGAQSLANQDAERRRSLGRL